MNKGAIFPLFYLPPTEYFSHMLSHDEIYIECSEHFPKQTYRNRATIQSPDGKLDLIIPVVKGSKVHTPIKDVRISYDFKWQRLHWLSLQTSYRSSVYFEFYEDEFAPFYHKKWEFLFDYNEEFLRTLTRLLKLDITLSFTDEYQKNYPETDDFRESIHPKRSTSYKAKPYFQVFEERNGFIPNLTAADLLFSQGPQSQNYL